MRADITQAGGAQQRVADGVRQRVSIGVAHRALVERDFNPAQNELSARRQPVQIVPDTGIGSTPSLGRHAFPAQIKLRDARDRPDE